MKLNAYMRSFNVGINFMYREMALTRSIRLIHSVQQSNEFFPSRLCFAKGKKLEAILFNLSLINLQFKDKNFLFIASFLKSDFFVVITAKLSIQLCLCLFPLYAL